MIRAENTKVIQLKSVRKLLLTFKTKNASLPKVLSCDFDRFPMYFVNSERVQQLRKVTSYTVSIKHAA